MHYSCMKAGHPAAQAPAIGCEGGKTCLITRLVLKLD